VKSRFLFRSFLFHSCSALFLLSLALVGSASAQGTNVVLRANANPRPAHHSYANVWGNVSGSKTFAYVGSYDANGVLIFDITNPDAPILAANYTYRVSNPVCGTNCDNQLEDVEVQNGIGYFASNTVGGIHIVNLSNPYQPTLITRITSAIGGWDGVHTLLVDGDYLYVPHFLVDPFMQVWNISNPAAPVLMWTFKTTDPNSIRASSIFGNTLYTSGWGGHTDIWDVTNIATEPPQLLGTIVSGNESHSSSVTPDGNYLVGSRELDANGGDVSIYNVSNPSAVTKTALITMPEFGIESVSPHNPAVVGNLLYNSWYDAGLEVFDITNRANPVLVGSYDTWLKPITIGSYDGDWGVYPYLGQNEILVSDQDTGLYILDATGVNSTPILFNYLVAPPPATSSVAVTGATPSVAGTPSATVYLTGVAPAGGVTVTLSSTGPASTNSSVTIPAGKSSASTTVHTSTVSSATAATLTASYNGQQVAAALTVVPPLLSSFSISPSPTTGGNIATGKVVATAAQPSQTAVSLAIVSGASAIASMPSTVHIQQGGTNVSFQIVTAAVTTSTAVTVSATVGPDTLLATFNVVPNTTTQGTPSSISFLANPLLGSDSTTGVVNLVKAVSTATTVNLAVQSGASAISSLPATVTVPANATSASFPITTASVGSNTPVQIAASTSAGSATATLTVEAPAPVTVQFLTSPVIGGNSTQVRVIMQQIVLAATTVNLSVTGGASAVKSIPASVSVSPGHNTVVFTLSTNAVSAATTVSIKASANGGSATGSETVNP
jgi:hypothetical protein